MARQQIIDAFRKTPTQSNLYKECLYKDLKYIEYYTFDPHYVYFISCGNFYIKIGMTKHLQRRLSSIQTGMPFDLKVVGLIEVANRTVAKEVEDYLHELFNEYRKRGEWFDFRPVYDWILQSGFKDRPRQKVINHRRRKYESFKKKEAGSDPAVRAFRRTVPCDACSGGGRSGGNREQFSLL